MELKNKVAIITGASSGLGRAVALKLAQEKCRVILLARREERLKKVKDEILRGGGKAEYFVCDIADPEQVGEAIKAAGRKFGSIDILINNAGVWLGGRLEDSKSEFISKVIDINLKGLIYVTKAVLPFLLKKNKGFILNVSSSYGLKACLGESVYAASKWGVTGFTECLKLDLMSTNIKVAGFYPGGMKTDLFKKAGGRVNNQNWMSPDKVAEVIVFILKRDETMIIDHLVLNRKRN